MRIDPIAPSFTSNIKKVKGLNKITMEEIEAAYKKVSEMSDTPEYKEKLAEMVSYNRLLAKELNELYNLPINYLFTYTKIKD